MNTLKNILVVWIIAQMFFAGLQYSSKFTYWSINGCIENNDPKGEISLAKQMEFVVFPYLAFIQPYDHLECKK